MRSLQIQLKRMADGCAALTCTRADGTVIWQRQSGQRGLVFPTHDLTHYVVETVLGYQHGFYGLLAGGWEFGDFSAPWPRGVIPLAAREAELVVGIFETERRMGGGWSGAELREQGKTFAAAQKPGRPHADMPALTDEQVEKIHALQEEVLARWAATKQGETLELVFA